MLYLGLQQLSLLSRFGYLLLFLHSFRRIHNNKMLGVTENTILQPVLYINSWLLNVVGFVYSGLVHLGSAFVDGYFQLIVSAPGRRNNSKIRS